MTVHWRSNFKGDQQMQREHMALGLYRLRGSHVSEGAWYSRIDGYLMSDFNQE
jgi:hypothetical protein